VFVRFFIMVELGAAVVCILVLISSTVRPSEFSLILSWSEERGEALESLYVYVLRWFLYTTEATLYLSLRCSYTSPNNCTCTRSMGGPLVRIIDQNKSSGK